MNYACYIFAWDTIPNGGVRDLIMCCNTIKEGKRQAEKASRKYSVVQLMSADGTIIKH